MDDNAISGSEATFTHGEFLSIDLLDSKEPMADMQRSGSANIGPDSFSLTKTIRSNQSVWVHQMDFGTN